MSWLNKLKLGGIRTQGGNKRGVPEEYAGRYEHAFGGDADNPLAIPGLKV